METGKICVSPVKEQASSRISTALHANQEKMGISFLRCERLNLGSYETLFARGGARLQSTISVAKFSHFYAGSSHTA